MNATEARKIFDAAIAKTKDAGKVSNLELVREYCTNQSFRKALHDYVWQINSAEGR